MAAKKRRIKLGPVGQKILLLLLAGVALGLSGSPRRYFRILKTAARDWQTIDRYALHRALRRLYRMRLIKCLEHSDGSSTLILTDGGKQQALRYDLDTIKIAPMERWDRRWRVVLFDIPERAKRGRDALAQTLKKMGFYQFQKSVFVHPFECRQELKWVVEFFNLRPYVCLMIVSELDYALKLKKYFNLV